MKTNPNSASSYDFVLCRRALTTFETAASRQGFVRTICGPTEALPRIFVS